MLDENQTAKQDHTNTEIPLNTKLTMIDKSYADKKRHAITCQMLQGNTVFVRQHRKDKLTSPFDQERNHDYSETKARDAETAPNNASYAEPEATRSKASPAETTPKPWRSSRLRKTPAHLDVYKLVK